VILGVGIVKAVWRESQRWLQNRGGEQVFDKSLLRERKDEELMVRLADQLFDEDASKRCAGS